MKVTYYEDGWDMDDGNRNFGVCSKPREEEPEEDK